MSILCRVLIVVNLVAVAAYLFVYAVFFAFETNFRDVLVLEKGMRLKEIQRWDRVINEQRDEVRVVADEIEVLKNREIDLRHNITVDTRIEEDLIYANQELKHDIAQVSTEAQAVERLHQRMVAENNRIEALIGAVTAEITEVEVLRERAVRRANRLADEIEQIQERMQQLKAELKDVQDDVLAKKLIINLYVDNNVYPSSYRYTGRLIAGRVLVVDDERSLVVIDRGSQQGVRPGIIIFLQRDGNYVGAMRVRTVRENVSEGPLLEPEGMRLKPQEGDEAFTPGRGGRAEVVP